MKSKKYRLDRQVDALAKEMAKIRLDYLRKMEKKQAPLWKKVKELKAKAEELKYNRKKDPCPICKGTGRMVIYIETQPKERCGYPTYRGKIKEKKVPCKYCEVVHK